jgi:integrase
MAISRDVMTFARGTFDEWEAAYVAIRSHQVALSSFYGEIRWASDYLFRRDLCPVNPLSKMRRAKAQTRKGDVLGLDEFNDLLKEPKSPQERITIAIYAWTAARANEIIAAYQGDVRLGEGTITIRTSKTRAGERVIPTLPELQEELQRWFNHLRALGLRDDRLPLLVTSNKTPMKHAYCWRVLKRVAARGGVRPREARHEKDENLSDITLHTLRRTLSTRLLNGYGERDPVRAETLKSFLGHGDIRITLAYYAEVEQEKMISEIRRAVAG